MFVLSCIVFNQFNLDTTWDSKETIESVTFDGQVSLQWRRRFWSLYIHPKHIKSRYLEGEKSIFIQISKKWHSVQNEDC